MTDLLLGQSYYLRFDPKLYEAMQPYPPLGTLYAASYARSKGYSVALFDAMLADSEAEWAAALDEHRPRFACLFEDNFNYLSKMCLLRMREAAFRMIEMAKTRGVPVILCGADMTDHADLYFTCGADYILLGEGELTLGELLDALTGRSSQPLDQITGLASRLTPPGHPRPGLPPLPCLGFGRHPALPENLGRAPGLLLDESRHDARLPLPLQLVRQAHLGSALQRALA